LIVPRNQNGDLLINTPASYRAIRLLCLSTEGTSLVNVKLFFTDGSSTNALTNVSVNDWFNTSANTVLAGFGRCTRVANASSASAFPNNPKLFYVEVNLNCADAQKSLQKINCSNVTTAGTNAPFPNAVFFAVSGKVNTINITPSITNATCSSQGSATLDITGSAGPYTASWNTNPVQNGLTATNLAAGNYIATVTDANSCTSTFNVTVTSTNNLTLTAHADTAICLGSSFQANTISNATNYIWTPTNGVSNPNIANPTLSPNTTTTYTLTARLGTCSLVRTFRVTVNAPTISNRADTSICNGVSFMPNIVSNGTSFSWTPTTGVSNPNIANPMLSPSATTLYTLTANQGLCTAVRIFQVAVLQSVVVDAGSPISILSGSSGQLYATGSVGNYLWTPSSTLNAANILNPVASPTATTQYTLTITTAAGCKNKDSVLVTVVPYCIKPLNAFSPNGDGINDLWLVTNDNCTTNIRAFVYNRYGSEVYKSSNYQNDWNGTYKGKPLPDGTYYYVLEFTLLTGTKITLKGNVTLVR
jgi:gliding motility-associated-like protein